MPRNKYKHLEYADKSTEEFLQAIEELVDVARNTPDPKSYKLDDDVENFVLDVGVKNGTTVVDAWLVYYEYLLWSEALEDSDGYAKYSYEEFFYRFSRKYKPKKRNTGTGYKLNKDVFGKYKLKTKEELAQIKAQSLQHRKIAAEQIESSTDGQEDIF